MIRRLALALILAGCSPQGEQPGKRDAPAVSPFTSPALIFPAVRGLELLNQCSRDIPQNIADTWQPMPSDVVQLESRLLPWLAQQRPAYYPAGQHVEILRVYAGYLMQDGRRIIYLDGYRLGPDDPPSPPPELPDRPFNSVCDGGPSYFGVEYDVKAKTFSNLHENGIA